MRAQQTNVDLSSSIDTDEEDFCWVSYFLTIKGNDLFCEVDYQYLHDKFNLTGLITQVTYYEYALDLIRDVENEDYDELSDEHQEMVENDAKALYGLIHARYILTNAGLRAMLVKYQHHAFGTCPRYHCKSQPVLPTGVTDEKGKVCVKLYCPRCEELYRASAVHETIDGAYFGTTFVHLFFLIFPELKPSKTKHHYTPRVFGYKLHKTCYERSLETAKERKKSKFNRFVGKKEKLPAKKTQQ